MSDKALALAISLGIISTVIGASFLFFGGNNDRATVNAPEEDRSIVDAKIACKESIRERLHDPKSAEFPSLTEFNAVAASEPNVYIVEAQVRAKNLMNALVSNVYRCEIRNLSRPSSGGLNWKSEVIVIQ